MAEEPDAAAPPAQDPLTGAGAPLRWLDRATAAVSGTAAVVGAVVTIVLMLIVGYSVFWRYVLGEPITWTDELSGYLVVALVMLGVAEALRRGDHINVDLITSRLPPRARRWAMGGGMVASIAVGVVLLISAIETVSFSYSMNLLSEGYLEMPMWIPKSALILGSAMLILAATTALLRLAAGRPAHDGDG